MLTTSEHRYRCGLCKEPGHNRRSCCHCLKKTTKGKGKIILNYTPLVSCILDFLVTEKSYKELYDLSKVSTTFKNSIHFLTRKVLEIETDTCTNRTFKYIQCFPQVRKLNLSRIWCRIEEMDEKLDRGLKHGSSFTELTHLDLSGNETIPTKVLSYFQNNTKLEYLKLSMCAKIKNNSLSYLKHFPNLTYLNLRHTNITNLRFLKHCPNLETLKIECLNLSDKDLVCLKSCTKLRVLSMDSCRNISNEGFKHICCLSSLERLHITNSELINNGVTLYLKRMPLLNYLALDYCPEVVDTTSLNHVAELYRDDDFWLDERFEVEDYLN